MSYRADGPSPEKDFEEWRNEFPQYHSYASVVAARVGCTTEIACKVFWGVLQMTIDDGDDPDGGEPIEEDVDQTIEEPVLLDTLSDHTSHRRRAA